MTRTYTDHSAPNILVGSALRAGIAALGASSAATPPAAPLRRALLAGGATALVVAGTAAAVSAPSASPDAGLVALCARLDALQRQIDELFPADWCGIADSELEAADAAAHRIEGEQRPILDQLCALTPTTLDGCVALARSVALLRPDLVRAGPHEDPDVRLAAVLVRGLAGRA